MKRPDKGTHLACPDPHPTLKPQESTEPFGVSQGNHRGQVRGQEPQPHQPMELPQNGPRKSRVEHGEAGGLKGHQKGD